MLENKITRLLLIFSLAAFSLFSIYIGRGIALFAAMLIGGGGYGAAGEVMSLFEPIGHYAVALIIGAGIAASMGVLVSNEKNLNISTVVGMLLGSAIAVCIPQVGNQLVSITLKLMPKL